jgi:hypothetical protein
MQEHFHLTDGVSEAETIFVFKDAFKHTYCISIATYYMQVLKQQMKPTQVKGVYLTKDQHLQGTAD